MRRWIVVLVIAGCAEAAPVAFAGPPGSAAPSLAVHGGRAFLSWIEPAGRGHRVMLAVRDAEGWSEPRPVVAGEAVVANWADFAHVEAFADGALLAHWLERTAPDAHAYHVMMAVSHDDGRTWSAPFRPHGDRSATEHGFVAMAPVRDSVAAVWLDGRHAPTMTVRFTTIGSDGAAAPDRLVDSLTCECCQTALVATPSGLVTAYRDRTREEIRDVVVRRRTATGWSPPVTARADRWHYPGCPVNGPQLAARGDTVALAWFTAAGDTARVYAAVSPDAGARFDAPVRVDDGHPLGRVDVVALPDGDVAVAWLEQVGDAGEMRIRRVGAHGAPGRAVTLGTVEPTRRAGFPRLAVVPEGILAAWTRPAGEGVVVRHLVTLP